MIPTGARVWIALGHTDMRRYVADQIMWSPEPRH
jgi:hypothetical protein